MPALRVGHKGAALIEQGNTIAAFEAGVGCDVDMLEFDVLPDGDRLVLAHDLKDLERRRETVLTLEDALDHLEPTGLKLDVDLKTVGYERRTIAALRERGMAERALISTMEIPSLELLRATEPDIRLGWSVPKAKRNPFNSPLTKPLGLAGAEVLRRRLPAQLAAAIRDGKVDAIMSHFAVVTPRMVEAVQAAGGELYVWTVDDGAVIARLDAMGVDGIITNDPRLFGPRANGTR